MASFDLTDAIRWRLAWCLGHRRGMAIGDCVEHAIHQVANRGNWQGNGR